ncbi:MAG: SoxR reducing system RseC family protein [Sphaerochaetaceae bacterium]|nr:SoxR reducing system RseC family protein [Sphaerochaetaceae bacterium]MDC7237503.1 SoxR reducing system RseC family protein [Sphaerochaetaceae bacterium]MDC7248481.1 SoxR reducing system RseC family protein [Sphaerochaetaceae bacterium]
MVEIVEVVKINNDNSVEVTCPTTACKGCSGNMFCNVKGKTFSAKVDKGFEKINVGDSLKIFLPPARTISTSFITLMIPLLMFPIFYLLSPAAKESFKFLSGILGIALGFVGVGIYFHYSKNKYYPRVVEKLN